MRILSAPVAIIAIWVSYLNAYAQDAAKTCNADCLLQRIDTLEKKVADLENTIETLTPRINNSIKSGQNVTLHTQNGQPGGCLTYVGPSGDQGGLVSWNVNCSRDTLWTIN